MKVCVWGGRREIGGRGRGKGDKGSNSSTSGSLHGAVPNTGEIS